MTKNAIRLSDRFTVGRLLRFVYPSIVMMMFTSIYTVVDGFFVSNFAGKTAFSAVNFIMPYLMLLSTPAFMLGTGGSALISKLLGEKRTEDAREVFSLLLTFTLAFSLLMTTAGLLLLRSAAVLLGAEGRMLEDCITYGRIFALGTPFMFFQVEFQSLLVVAERPKLGLVITVASGVTNILLDSLLVGALSLGIVGAAAASVLSQAVGGVWPVLWILTAKNTELRLTRFCFDGASLVRILFNGSSELLSNISMSLVNMVYNAQLLRYVGEDGVAAYGVMMYVSFFFCAVFIGYTMGAAPVIGYNYGADNREELSGLLKKSIGIVCVFSVSMFTLCITLARPVAVLFAGYDDALCALTAHGFTVFSFAFLFMGIGIFGSGFFTALNNGLLSAILSGSRVLVFQMLAVLLLPRAFGVDGIWFSLVAAECASVILTSVMLAVKRRQYGY